MRASCTRPRSVGAPRAVRPPSATLSPMGAQTTSLSHALHASFSRRSMRTTISAGMSSMTVMADARALLAAARARTLGRRHRDGIVDPSQLRRRRSSNGRLLGRRRKLIASSVRVRRLLKLLVGLRELALLRCGRASRYVGGVLESIDGALREQDVVEHGEPLGGVAVETRTKDWLLLLRTSCGVRSPDELERHPVALANGQVLVAVLIAESQSGR